MRGNIHCKSSTSAKDRPTGQFLPPAKAQKSTKRLGSPRLPHPGPVSTKPLLRPPTSGLAERLGSSSAEHAPAPAVPVTDSPPDFSGKRLRILIADDHAVVLHGLRALLESQPGFEVVGEATNGIEAIDRAHLLRPDLVILDISMSELNGLEATRAIRLRHPEIEVLILTMHFSEQMARQILRAGARGYVLKTDPDSLLLSAINNLRQHKPLLTPRVADVVLTGYVDGDVVATIKRAVAADFPYGPLSHRERQVLQLLAEGNTNKEIAARLGVSPRTVETHRNHVMHKLRLNSLSDLIRYALRNNVVEV